MKNIKFPKRFLVFGGIFVSMVIYIINLNINLNHYKNMVQEDLNQEFHSILVFLIQTNDYIESLQEEPHELRDPGLAFYFGESSLEISGRYDAFVDHFEEVTNIRLPKEQLSVFLLSFHQNFRAIYHNSKKEDFSTEVLESLNRKKQILEQMEIEIRKVYNLKDFPDKFNEEKMKKTVVQLNTILEAHHYTNE